MKTWHGYPIPDDAHPERPWWRERYLDLVGLPFPAGWIRSDGEKTEADLAAIDRSDPLPAPPPLCGQVWYAQEGDPPWIEAGDFYEIVAISRGLPVVVVQNNTIDAPMLALCRAWPPHGAVLVSGPGSPWAPPEYEPEEVKP